jgi:predicted nucleic-acid-binding protein
MLETNVLARYYVDEGGAARAQQEAARTVVERGTQLFVAKTVVLELEWVLRGVYGHPRSDVCRVFEHLLSLEHVTVEDRPAVESALGNLRKGLDFADALTFDAKGFAGEARRLAITPPVRLAG